MITWKYLLVKIVLILSLYIHKEILMENSSIALFVLNAKEKERKRKLAVSMTANIPFYKMQDLLLTYAYEKQRKEILKNWRT